MGILNHMDILDEPLLSSHLSYASNFGLSLDRLLKTGLTVYTHYSNDFPILNAQTSLNLILLPVIMCNYPRRCNFLHIGV